MKNFVRHYGERCGHSAGGMKHNRSNWTLKSVGKCSTGFPKASDKTFVPEALESYILCSLPSLLIPLSPLKDGKLNILCSQLVEMPSEEKDY